MDLARTWAAFYISTIKYDEVMVEPDWRELSATVSGVDTLFKGNHPKLCKEALVFGELMACLPGVAEPCGTECRTPCRTFFVLNNPKQKVYRNYITFGGDFHSIANWVHLFSNHIN